MTEYNWHDDPELVRQPDEDDLQQIDLEPRWQRLFAMVEIMFVPNDTQGWGPKAVAERTQRAVIRGFLWNAKKKVAENPDGARQYVIEAMYAIAATLEVEPRELYPDLKVKSPEPAVA